MASITTTFDVGSIVYYVEGEAIKLAVVVSVNILKISSGTTITYGFNSPIQVTEDRLFVTAQEAADDFSERLITVYEATL